LENVNKKANDLFQAETEGCDEVKVQGSPCIQQINFYKLLGKTNSSNWRMFYVSINIYSH